jgi:hypothetical protein
MTKLFFAIGGTVTLAWFGLLAFWIYQMLAG